MLVRVRNPWGESEWNGAWSDSSAEWKRLSAVERADFGLVVENDGEFWYSTWLLIRRSTLSQAAFSYCSLSLSTRRMSLDDFLANFTDLDICHMSADAFGELEELFGDAGASREGNGDRGTKAAGRGGGGSGDEKAAGEMRRLGGEHKKCWTCRMEYSAWRANVSAGGSRPVRISVETLNDLVQL